jgi:prenylcysteine oxidase/farnesylcysteine lyase
MKRFHNLLSQVQTSQHITTYKSPWEILEQSSMTSAVANSATQRLKWNHIGGNYVHEILAPQVRRQTGCEIEELSDLALSMGVEREDQGTCLEGHEGSFLSTMEGLASWSKATVKLSTKITGLKRNLTETKEMWILESTLEGGGKRAEVFDHIILATPYNTTLLGLPVKEEEMSYKPAYLTFFSTTTNPEIMKGIHTLLPITPSSTIRGSSTEIYELTYLRESFTFKEQSSLVESSFIYRISSNLPLSDTEIEVLFGEGNVKDIVRQEMEFGWPVLRPRSNGEELEGWEVEGQKGLWTTAGGEGVVSSVEWMFLVGGVLGRAVVRRIEEE